MRALTEEEQYALSVEDIITMADLTRLPPLRPIYRENAREVTDRPNPLRHVGSGPCALPVKDT